jgi:hypothetical protein|tara:strand:+ start:203 stop:622 length:420 start_codon:yes stop_codon:yes gene_type:complete
MSSTYVEITLEEMQQCLPKDKGWEVLVGDFSSEYVFGWQIPSKPDLLIKVYTSIRKQNAVGRSKGQDAIRVVCVLHKDGKTQPVVSAKDKRVNRTTNWRVNLRKLVVDVMNKSKERYGWAMQKLEEQDSPVEKIGKVKG